jgi:hypothetical protein
MQHLQGDITSDGQVARPIHDSHSAAADFLNDLIARRRDGPRLWGIPSRDWGERRIGTRGGVFHRWHSASFLGSGEINACRISRGRFVTLANPNLPRGAFGRLTFADRWLSEASVAAGLAIP